MGLSSLTAFGDFLNIEMGQSPGSISVNQNGTGTPLLNGPAEFTERFPVPVQYTTQGNRFAEKNDILFCVRGSTTGRMNIADQKYAIGRGLAAISHKQGRHLNSFVKGLIELNLTSLLGGTPGSVFPNLTKDQLYQFKCAIPDPITQRQISIILSSLDDRIELNNEINAELEGIAKTLYDYWFLQFDFPDKNGQPYRSSGGKMIYNVKLKQYVPKGWDAKNLNYFIAKGKSGDWGKEQIEGNYTTKVECIRGADINGINGKGEVKTPSRFILEKNGYKILTPNDLVVEISGGSPIQSTGRLACVTAEVLERFENPLICSNFCKAVSLISEEVVFYFTHSWNKAYDNGVFFGFEGKTSGIKNLLFDSLVMHYQIPLPHEELLMKFQEKIALFEKQKQINLKQNQELAALRDWLLPMLMNGQVKVGDIAAPAGSPVSLS